MTVTIPHEEYQRLLRSWRHMLGICLRLQDTLAPDQLPLDVAQGIMRAREEIAHMKSILRQSEESVIDLPDELVVADADKIAHQLTLLATYRRNLKHYRAQYESYGVTSPPPIVINSLTEAQQQVRTIKRRLREWQVPIVDLPEDAGIPSV